MREGGRESDRWMGVRLSSSRSPSNGNEAHETASPLARSPPLRLRGGRASWSTRHVGPGSRRHLRALRPLARAQHRPHPVGSHRSLCAMACRTRRGRRPRQCRGHGRWLLGAGGVGEAAQRARRSRGAAALAAAPERRSAGCSLVAADRAASSSRRASSSARCSSSPARLLTGRSGRRRRRPPWPGGGHDPFRAHREELLLLLPSALLEERDALRREAAEGGASAQL